MVRFTKIRWKNFLSTGNAWNEINLDGSGTTLIVGDNGSGKSTLLDALCFGLFGKPFRNVNKGQLLNSINQKQAIVEVEFRVGLHEYLVIRGMRPNLFEIHKDGTLLNQDASVKDYQSILEDQILNFTYKSFTQIVILGSASFTPFMQLPSGTRREIIEDLLDARIFSAMNKVLKERFGQLSADLMNIEGEVDLQKRKVMVQKAYVDTLKQDRQQKFKENQEAIDTTLVDIKKWEAEIGTTQTQISALMGAIVDQPEVQKLSRDLDLLQGKAKDNVRQMDKQIDFYEKNDACPTCKQGIERDYKEIVLQETKHSRISWLGEIEEIKRQTTKLEARAKEISETNIAISAYNSNIMKLNSQIQAGQQYVDKLLKLNADLEKSVGNIEDEKRKLRDESQVVVDLINKRSQLNEDRQYFNVATVLLKDTGIKTKIIRQYLPIINKLVNKYLQAMDLFVNFELDESFNETIKSRHRDEFTYASFSEGEKQRINLALLFAWRAVASVRNTTNTNLLLFDEILDGSLDATAVDYFLNLVKDIGHDHNIFVITHKSDLFVDKFDRVIRVKKVNGYSILEEADK
jgi:DNA repair exonuclease SbcCD ATPase subunit